MSHEAFNIFSYNTLITIKSTHTYPIWVYGTTWTCVYVYVRAELCFFMQHIVLLRVLERVGLHLHDAWGQWNALLWRLPAVQIWAFGVQWDGEAILLQCSNKYILCELEPVLYELHAEGIKSFSRHDIIRQYWTCLGGYIFGKSFHGLSIKDYVFLSKLLVGLQVISLEGWTDIMYYVQDAHSFWDWIYFVLLIVVSLITKNRKSIYWYVTVFFRKAPWLEIILMFPSAFQLIDFRRSLW